MYRIIDGRGTGKTSRLMLIAKDNDAIFVCGNPRAMEQKAHAYGITGITFMSYADFIMSRPGSRDQKYVVDELEGFIRTTHINSEFIGYTLSEDEND